MFKKLQPCVISFVQNVAEIYLSQNSISLLLKIEICFPNGIALALAYHTKLQLNIAVAELQPFESRFRGHLGFCICIYILLKTVSQQLH